MCVSCYEDTDVNLLSMQSTEAAVVDNSEQQFQEHVSGAYRIFLDNGTFMSVAFCHNCGKKNILSVNRYNHTFCTCKLKTRT